MLRSVVSSDLVRNELEGLNSAFSELLLVCEKLRPLVQDLTEFDLWLGSIDTDIFLIKNSAIRYIRDREPKESSNRVSSKRTKSTRSTSSSISTASQKMLKEATELAGLEVELAFADRKGISENDRIQLEENIAKKRAVLGVYENWQSKVTRDEIDSDKNSISFESSFSVETKFPKTEPPKPMPVSPSENKPVLLPVPPCTLRTRAPRRLPRFKTPVDGSAVVNKELFNAILDLVKIQGVPSVEVSTFSGNPLDYRFFMTNFEDLVEKRIPDSEGRLARLLKYTTGDANELIQCCLYKSDGYEYAKSLLKKKYGDPHRIMIAYKKQLYGWENVKLGDSTALSKFHSFLLKCGSVIEGSLWNSFDTADNLCIIASKLPGPCQDKWNRKVIEIRSRLHREPSFKDLLSFVE